MNFSTPFAFGLLFLVPFFVWLGRPKSRTARWRMWLSLALRLIILLLLVFGLAGTRIVRAADELAVVFLLDASDSIPQDELIETEEIVRQAVEEMGPADQAAVVLFGANALVDRPMSALAELAPVRTIPLPLGSDIAEAIRLGLALFPPGAARRIVLLSDGSATNGDAKEAAQLAAAAGVQIDVIPLGQEKIQAEASLTSVDAPSRVREGESFSVQIAADSNTDTSAQLRVLAGDMVIFDSQVALRKGTNNFVIPLRAAAQDFIRYVVQMTPLNDTYYHNNQLAAYTQILGPPRILLVAHDESSGSTSDDQLDESQQIRLALEAAGLVVDQESPVGLSSNLAELAGYDSIILVDVNAKELTPRKMDALESYVRDLGGGLVAVGGPYSFGMGGYFRTPLENALPVDMQIKDQERFPAVSMVLVIDRSGSMGMQEGSLTKIQLAAEGAVRVVELLNDFDEITIIPVDTVPDYTIGPTLAANRGEIIGQIRRIGSGGGGIYVRTGMEAAADALSRTVNEIKHIIVLADGSDSEEKEGVPELIEVLADEGVTISMVSIGGGPDVPWLERMAELGGGRFHLTDQAANIPQIFTQETTSIQRSYLVEERFFPQLGTTGFASRHPIFKAMEKSQITLVPPLFGYVGTSPKETAQVILETHLGDPLLAAWDYGLGRSVAFTSDATSRWARSWVTWSGFPTFWSNLVRWTISESRESSLESMVTFEGDKAQMTVDAFGPDGSYFNDLLLEANIISPDGAVTGVQFRQIAPGQYSTQFVPEEEGAYLIHITGTSGGEDGNFSQTLGWVLGYSPEYRQHEPNLPLLTQITEVSSGRLLDRSNSAELSAQIFNHNLPGQSASRPIWPWLLIIAAILLPFDIAARRLVLTRQDVRGAWAVTLGRLSHAKKPDPDNQSRVGRLFEAKSRAGVYVPPVSDEAGDEGEQPKPIFAPQDPDESHSLEPAKPPKQDTEKAPPAEEDGETLAARLLARKRNSKTP